MRKKSKVRMSVDWRNASDRFHEFRAFDKELQYDLARLCMEQARDDKLAEKLEAENLRLEGRVLQDETEAGPGEEAEGHGHC